MINPEHIEIGMPVRTTIDLYNLPRGSTGVIDSQYYIGERPGWMVIWNGRNGLSDGFAPNELYMLEEIRGQD